MRAITLSRQFPATVPFIGMLLWTLAAFTAYAFTYTYLWNRTQSAFLCMLLHASYNTAIGVVLLRPADELVGSSYVAISFALTGALWLAALALIVATRGRLGLPAATASVSGPRPGSREARTVPAPGAASADCLSRTLRVSHRMIRYAISRWGTAVRMRR